MAESSNRRAEIIAEHHELSVKHTNALQDATFIGWQPGQIALHEERSERMVLLRSQLASLDGD